MQVAERSGDERRIGISIEIPDPMASELQNARRAFGDPLADAIPPHITLIGPTDISNEQFAAIDRHIAAVCASMTPFHVHLRGSATFRPVSPVVFIQVVAGISACERLESSLRAGPLAQDTKFNYHPHVTVAHNIEDELLDQAFNKMAFYEAEFEVANVHLYEHGEDNVWRTILRYPLGGGLEAGLPVDETENAREH